MKTRIVEYLGHSELVLPQLVEEGLAANDRAKVRLAILQATAHHARNPALEPADISEDCRRVGIDADPMQALLKGAHMAPGHTIGAPGLERLIDDLIADVGVMIAPVAAADAGTGEVVKKRLVSISEKIPLVSDSIAERDVADLIDVTSDKATSLHRLIMDLHKKLNVLAADCADEDVAGARVRGLRPDDVPIVAAFMKGLEETRHLKFDHPGLDTTATRSGDRVVIQNDIGTTDAHVILVSVQGCSVEVHYTDVHRARAEFFVGLLSRFAATWTGLDEHTVGGLARDNAFFMVGCHFNMES